jgi:hypothetical protein
MSTPPVPPEIKRQTKNQPKLRGSAQAKFLATDLSDYVTGAVIPIDGGLVRG